ncbi:MAG: COG3014 family protein [Nitrospirota bacterium]
MVWTEKDQKDHRKEKIRVLTLIHYLFLIISLSLGCAPISSHYLLVESKISEHAYSDADAIIEKNKENYGKRNAVLYYMDRGMTLHLAGRYRESNNAIFRAEEIIDRLYTKSISTEGSAMLTNDNMLPYEGEDFEKVMLNVIAALNYVYMGEWEDALVEARKVDHKLNLYNDRYTQKNIYKEDAFARYLSGILYESQGELNDAFISYRKAYETFRVYKRDYGTPIPSMIVGDLLRITDALGLIEEHREYEEEFPDTSWDSYKEFKEKGEIIFVSYNGKSPVKVDYFINAPVPDGSGGTYLLNIALPKFVVKESEITESKIYLKRDDETKKIEKDAYLVEDISAIAVKNLEDRIARISAKAIARATAKYIAARKLRKKAAKKNDPLITFITDISTNIYSIITEQADKRSWRTLPAEIYLGRIAVPPGKYEVEAVYISKKGNIVERKKLTSISLGKGEKRFLSYRILR